MNKLLTFAVPTYNMEDYLENCILSCVCENMKYLEIIVVNDGSRDRSSEIGHKLENEYPDVVRVIDKENGNYGTCVNRALSEANGKYFKMLDPDDWVDSDALNSLLEKMKTVDSDLFVTVSEDRRYEDKILLSRMSIPQLVEEGKIYNARSFDGIAMNAKYFYCSHNFTYRTEILRNIKLELKPGISFTDNEFVFYPLDQIQTMVFFDLPLYQYLAGRPGASTVDISNKALAQMWVVLRDIFEYFYSHYDITPEPVRNNQRILIIEMVKWILCPIFGDLSFGEFEKNNEREAIFFAIQPFVSKDRIIQDRISRFFSLRRFDWYKHYRSTGKLLEFTPVIDFDITFSYIKAFIIRMLNL